MEPFEEVSHSSLFPVSKPSFSYDRMVGATTTFPTTLNRMTLPIVRHKKLLSKTLNIPQSTILLNGILLNVIHLNVILLIAILLIVKLLCVIQQNAILLYGILLNVTLLSVIPISFS
jgi:hypothetical protein